VCGDGELKKELEFGEGKIENGKWNSIRREFFLEFKGEQIESKKYLLSPSGCTSTLLSKIEGPLKQKRYTHSTMAVSMFSSENLIR
jgi:hypothetical protein